jgi:hypothetical protein
VYLAGVDVTNGVAVAADNDTALGSRATSSTASG